MSTHVLVYVNLRAVNDGGELGSRETRVLNVLRLHM